MTWLAWRQLRTQAVLAAAVAVAVVVTLMATRGAVSSSPDPGALQAPYDSLRLLGTALVGLPAFIGAFWGAPLVARELETGTHRLVWAQSITRSRWLATKLLVIGAATVAFTGACTWALTWWSAPYDDLGNRIGTANFGQRGVAPIAYALFALVLGTLVGLLMRRTLPAMVATLVGFFIARFGFQTFIRAHLLPTATATRPTTLFGPAEGRTAASGGWVLSSRTVDASGHAVSSNGVERLLQDGCSIVPETTAAEISRCAHTLGIQDVVRMHPASQFWGLQAAEAAAFVALAALLLAGCFWWLRHRAG